MDGSKPRPMGYACGDGHECTGDGTCIKARASCSGTNERGCGLVTITGASYKMGWMASAPEQPYQPVKVRTFVMDAQEVSVGRFRQYWERGPELAPPVKYPNGAVIKPTVPREEPLGTSHDAVMNWSAEPTDREALPINRITWETAFGFCAWDGGRLPTEAEWEYAAAGRFGSNLDQGRTYPWGEEEPSCALSTFVDCSPRTLAVDTLPDSGGLYHLGGNVAEWVADDFAGYFEPDGKCWQGLPQANPLCTGTSGGVKVVRGSSFLSGQHEAVWRSGRNSPSAGRGVRCVRDPIVPPLSVSE